MTRFFKKMKKKYFWPIFSNFWAKELLWKIWLCHVKSYGLLAPCQYLDKTNSIIPRKSPDGKTDAKMNRLYFIRPFQLLQGGTKNEMSVTFVENSSVRAVL